VRIYPGNRFAYKVQLVRMERTYLDDMGNRRVLNPDEEASRKELKLGPSYQYS